MSKVMSPLRVRRGTRSCYVHVGTHKTGTTSIQCFLTGNRQRFADHGVHLPTAGCDEDATVAHHQIARELMELPGFDPARGGLDRLADELRHSSAPTACLSSELFSFLYDKPAALTRLRDAILAAGFTPRIVVYLRPQASYCTALYAENVRQGYRLPFATYFDDILTHGAYRWNGASGPPLDYTRLLDGFAAVFGRTAIEARRYRPRAANGHLVTSFARLLLPRGARVDAFDVPKLRHNPSLTFADVLRCFEASAPVDARLRFAPLGLARVVQLSARFGGSNLRLAQRHGVGIPPFESDDMVLALPVTPAPSRARDAARARRALYAARPERPVKES